MAVTSHRANPILFMAIFMECCVAYWHSLFTVSVRCHLNASPWKSRKFKGISYGFSIYLYSSILGGFLSAKQRKRHTANTKDTLYTRAKMHDVGMVVDRQRAKVIRNVQVWGHYTDITAYSLSTAISLVGGRKKTGWISDTRKRFCMPCNITSAAPFLHKSPLIFENIHTVIP